VKTRDRIRLKQIERQSEGLLELGLAQQALDNLARLGSVVTASPRALFLTGEALRMLNRCGEAAIPLAKAAEANPRDVRISLALGWCQKRTGRIDLAVQTMERAVALHPADALIHYNLACYLSLAGRKQPAIFHLSKAIGLDEHYRGLVDEERDFDPIRSDPQFQALTNIAV
jgi:Flp pilus assembly protein TadD